MDIKLFQSETSMFCEKVRIVLAMKNLPYEVVDVRKDDRKSLIAFSGQRKVPVMDHDGQRIIDSTVICAFLEETYPGQSIYPTGAVKKGLCLMLEDWADEVLNLPVRTIRWGQSPEAREGAKKDLEIHLRTLDQFFADGGFIFSVMTLADIAIFTQLHYLYTAAGHEIPPGFKKLHGWMALMQESLKLASLQDLAA